MSNGPALSNGAHVANLALCREGLVLAAQHQWPHEGSRLFDPYSARRLAQCRILIEHPRLVGSGDSLQ